MPRYDFHCVKCQHHFSLQVAMGSKDAKCPKCGEKAEKVFAAPHIHFKGSGFYVTDRSKSQSSSSASAESSSESPPPSKA